MGIRVFCLRYNNKLKLQYKNYFQTNMIKNSDFVFSAIGLVRYNKIMTVLRLYIIRTLIKNLNKNSTNKTEHFIVEVTIYTILLPFTSKKKVHYEK